MDIDQRERTHLVTPRLLLQAGMSHAVRSLFLVTYRFLCHGFVQVMKRQVDINIKTDNTNIAYMLLNVWKLLGWQAAFGLPSRGFLFDSCCSDLWRNSGVSFNNVYRFRLTHCQISYKNPSVVRSNEIEISPSLVYQCWPSYQLLFCVITVKTLFTACLHKN